MTNQSTAAKYRKVVANISLSLDGRVNGPGGDYDMGWIVPHAITSGARDHMSAVTAPATTVILGRKNYQGFGSYWPSVADDGAADPRDRAFSQWLNASEKVVFSHTLTEAQWHNSRIVAGDPVAILDGLRTQPGGDIIILASISLIKSLLQASALDRLSITLCPEIAGGGERLFEEGLPASAWVLDSNVATESGALCLFYDRRR
ncbi:MAG: dihydrofolate reductase family protein [Anaerolineales bacterium]|nr:dihydrofolate reductase family protein [Anaerolineales bacterium]